MRKSARAALLTNRIARDLKGVERDGVAAARVVTAKIRTKIMAAYRDGQVVPDVAAMIRDALLDSLVRAMIASHLQGMRRSRTMADDSAVKASVFDEVTKFLDKMKGADVTRLQQEYESEALAIVNRVGKRVQDELRDTTNELISSGAHVGEGVDVLREKFDKLGLTEKNGFQLETIFRTQTQLAYGAGRWQADQDPAVQEILWGYEYSAVGDDRTRPEHLALNGTRLPKDDPFWQRFWPPNGWNCRCVAIPIYEETAREVKPPDEVDGEPLAPDKGFDFNAGRLIEAQPPGPMSLQSRASDYVSGHGASSDMDARRFVERVDATPKASGAEISIRDALRRDDLTQRVYKKDADVVGAVAYRLDKSGTVVVEAAGSTTKDTSIRIVRELKGMKAPVVVRDVSDEMRGFYSKQGFVAVPGTRDMAWGYT